MSEAAAYTSLRATERGVMLFAQHCARLAAAGPACVEAFRQFAASAAPGVYAVRAHPDGDALILRAAAPGAGERDLSSAHLDVRTRPASALFDGMPSRAVVSPYAARSGRYAKPAPPSLYESVRLRGVATLLTSADGEEIYESCVAAVLAWDGARLLAAPPDRPAVDSTAIAALEREGMLTFAPLPLRSAMPLALVNAVAGLCLPRFEGRAAFPSDTRAAIESLFLRSCAR